MMFTKFGSRGSREGLRVEKSVWLCSKENVTLQKCQAMWMGGQVEAEE